MDVGFGETRVNVVRGNGQATIRRAGRHGRENVSLYGLFGALLMCVHVDVIVGKKAKGRLQTENVSNKPRIKVSDCRQTL